MSTKQKLVLLVLAAIVLVAAGVAAYTLAMPRSPDLHGTAVEEPPAVHDLNLLGTDGQEVRLAKWRGKYVLVFFGYANCPDVCPITMAELARTYQDLGEPEELQVLMVTVDPERDTPEQLEAYVLKFHPDFEGLTGTPAMIADASARFYVASVGSERNPDGRVSHSSHVTLVDPEGRMRLIYNQDKVGTLLKEDLIELLAQRGSW